MELQARHQPLIAPTNVNRGDQLTLTELRTEAAQQRRQANILLSHVIEFYSRIVASQPEHIAKGRLKLRHK